MENNRYESGEIVYFVNRNGTSNAHFVDIGVVDEQYSDGVRIDVLRPYDTRCVNGVPINEFETEQKYKKLPKGWTYDTKLFEITYKGKDIDATFGKMKVSNREDVKKAYEAGYLVKASTLFSGVIEADITKEGYRIVKKYPMWQRVEPTNMVLPTDKIYRNYDECNVWIENYNAELERQVSLSDNEWSLEQIDKTIGRFCKINGLDEIEKERYHNFFAEMDNIEDIEARIFNNNIQYKHWKRKKWNDVFLPFS